VRPRSVALNATTNPIGTAAPRSGTRHQIHGGAATFAGPCARRTGRSSKWANQWVTVGLPWCRDPDQGCAPETPSHEKFAT